MLCMHVCKSICVCVSLLHVDRSHAEVPCIYGLFTLSPVIEQACCHPGEALIPPWLPNPNSKECSHKGGIMK